MLSWMTPSITQELISKCLFILFIKNAQHPFANLLPAKPTPTETCCFLTKIHRTTYTTDLLMEFFQEFRLDIDRNGIHLLPPKSGIYTIINIVNRRCYVGYAINVRKRCQTHLSLILQGRSNNGVLEREIKIHGAAAFAFLCPQTIESLDNTQLVRDLKSAEVDWILRLQSHIEGRGYNSIVGNQWTKGAKLRDRERKLIRHKSYSLLDGVDLYDPISEKLVESYVREPYAWERKLSKRRI